MGKSDDPRHMYEHSHGKPQWSRPIYPDMSRRTLYGRAFWAITRLPSTPTATANWRFFWDYSGGNVYENMCHNFFWYRF